LELNYAVEGAMKPEKAITVSVFKGKIKAKAAPKINLPLMTRGTKSLFYKQIPLPLIKERGSGDKNMECFTDSVNFSYKNI